MPAITTTSNFATRLEQLGGVLQVYADVSGRAPANIVTAKGQQILLGIGNERRGEKHYPGLHELLAATAPQRGRITAERKAAGWRVGGEGPESRSLPAARARADELLGGAASAAFRINTGSAGAIDYVTGVTVGRVTTRGKKKGQLTFNKRSKTAVSSAGVSRAAARAGGARLLNRQALTVVLTIARREHSRLATAAQFLPKRYRSILRRRADLEYRNGQAVGIPSPDAAQQHLHDRVQIENRKGRTLGFLELGSGPGFATLHLRGELGIHTPAQVEAVNAALDLVTADTTAYVLRKLDESGRRALASLGGAR